MANYLFVQWKKPTDASRMVIDGEVCEYSGTDLQDKIMKLLSKVPKCKEICSNKNRSDLSPSFRCSYADTKHSRIVFVEGNFIETDIAGRNLVFIFATSENEGVKIAQILQEYALLLGVTPNAEDLNVIRTTKFKNKIKTALCVTIALFVLLFMLLSLLSGL